MFFPSPPDLHDPKVMQVIAQHDYFCSRTFHFQKKRLENNEHACINAEGGSRPFFAKLKHLLDPSSRGPQEGLEYARVGVCGFCFAHFVAGTTRKMWLPFCWQPSRCVDSLWWLYHADAL